MSGRWRPPAGTIDDHVLMEDHPVVDAVAAVLLSIGLGLFIALAIPTVAGWVQWLDDVVWELAVNAEWPPFVAVAKVLDFLGSTWVTAPLIVAVSLLLIWRRRWKTLTFWVIAMAVSQFLIGPVKGLYERERPPLPLVETSGFSFPSGHAVATAAIAVGLVVVFVRAGNRRQNMEILAGLVAIVMATSRVYLRAHWATDALAGAALGAAVVIVTASIVTRVAGRIRERSASRGSQAAGG